MPACGVSGWAPVRQNSVKFIEIKIPHLVFENPNGILVTNRGALKMSKAVDHRRRSPARDQEVFIGTVNGCIGQVKKINSSTTASRLNLALV